MIDTERKGVETTRLFNGHHYRTLADHEMRSHIFGGCISVDKPTACVIATCRERRVPTLVVSPPHRCKHWLEHVECFAPDLAVVLCYRTHFSTYKSKLLTADIVIVSPTSNVSPYVLNRVQRVVVDGSDHIVADSKIPCYLRGIAHREHIHHLWLVSDDPCCDDTYKNSMLLLLLSARGAGQPPHPLRFIDARRLWRQAFRLCKRDKDTSELKDICELQSLIMIVN